MKSLTKLLLATALIAVTGITFAKPYSANSADGTDRHLSGFNSINIAGSFDVYITQGSTESVNVEAPAEVMDHVITEVNGGVLKIYNKHDNWGWKTLFGWHKKMAVYVVVKEVNSIILAGSADVFFKEGISGNSLKLGIRGSGDMLGKIEVKTFEASISGSGDMKLSGHAENSTVTIAGSGDFTARSLVTVTTQVHIGGSGNAKVNASQKVDASVLGSGDIRYTGDAKDITQLKRGSGDIKRF